MILVGQYDSPYVRRVAVSLHVLGIPFTRRPLSVFGDADAMRVLNPVGRVPALVLDDGEVLIDSAAILDHLDEGVGPARALVPAHGAARRHALRTIALACGAIDKIGAMVYERVLRPPEKIHAPWLARCREQLDSALAALEAPAQAGELDGAAPAQAAITTACMVGYLHLRAAILPPGGAYPALDRLVAAAEATPAFVATRPAADETVPTTRSS